MPHNPDNWKHRSHEMKCRTCMHFAPKTPAEGDIIVIGRCRRRAPTLDGWPVMYLTDWCGDHKLDETRVAPVVAASDGEFAADAAPGFATAVP